MKSFPWWTDKHKRLAEEVKEFTGEILTRDAETRWTRKFPWDIYEKIGAKGFTGAPIPKEYGGLGLGATGACIVVEEMCRLPGPGRTLVGNMIGGLRQIIEFGSEEQKKRYLPRIARGELGAVVITEPVAGTDAAAIDTRATREGDHYVLNGKKRFIVSAGVANRYFVYARTSDNGDDIGRHRHLTAFMVEKGVAGLTVEKINEVIGFENVQNGVLDFDNVVVPVENRVGEEGQGWRVMTAGLNFERTLVAAMAVGWQKESLRSAVSYAKRRVQFARPTIDIAANQTKIADLILRLEMNRQAVFYTAHLWDLGWDITVEANAIKVSCVENALDSSIAAIQVMGGDGVTPFYPLQAIMQVCKVEQIAGGTMEACRQVIFRSGMKLLEEDLKAPRRVLHEELGIPVPTNQPPERCDGPDEDTLLSILAEDYRINPGLYMAREDISGYFTGDGPSLDEALIQLERKGLVKLYRAKKGIELVKATYDGLKKAHPKEHYRWYPEWADEERRF